MNQDGTYTVQKYYTNKQVLKVLEETVDSYVLQEIQAKPSHWLYETSLYEEAFLHPVDAQNITNQVSAYYYLVVFYGG